MLDPAALTRLESELGSAPDQPMLYRVLAKTLHRPLHRALCHLDRALSADTHADLEDVLPTLMEAQQASLVVGVWSRLNDAAETVLRQRAEQWREGRVTLTEALAMQRLAVGLGNRTVCEVGFHCGHSAVAFLLAATNIHLISFDIMQHPYSESCAAVVSRLFPHRFELVRGDSAVTLPRFSEFRRDVVCNVIRIDGSHDGDAPWRDAVGLLRSAVADGAQIVMDDVGCSAVNCLRPTEAWQRLVELGLVAPVECRVEDATHGHCIGRILRTPIGTAAAGDGS